MQHETGDGQDNVPADIRHGEPGTHPIDRQDGARAGGWLLADRYRIVDRLGAGGMADVFRAHDQVLARDVAVKVFRTRPPALHTAADAERQRLELHALATLNHPNLITLFDGAVTPPEGPPFLVMELVAGPTLAERIKASALPEAEVRDIGIQIADALTYVHARGMVHRDVKPANILLGGGHPDGESLLRARLSDFGIVRLLGSERLTSVDATLGTASYLAPEQARGADVGPVADVYALALVLIEALTGARSFEGPPLQAAMARLVRAPELPADVPAPWPPLLSAMTAIDPAARPTAQQVAATLRTGTTRSAITASVAPLPAAAVPAPAAVDVLSAAPEPSPRRGWGWLVAAAIATVLVGGGGLAYQLAQPESAGVAGPSKSSSSVRHRPSTATSAQQSSTNGPQVAVHDTVTPAQPTRSAAPTSSSPAPSKSPPASTPSSPSASAPPSNPPTSTATTAPTSSSAPASSPATTTPGSATSSASSATSSSSTAAG